MLSIETVAALPKPCSWSQGIGVLDQRQTRQPGQCNAIALPSRWQIKVGEAYRDSLQPSLAFLVWSLLWIIFLFRMLLAPAPGTDIVLAVR